MGRFQNRTDQFPIDQILARRRSDHCLSRIRPKHLEEQVPSPVALDCKGICSTDAIALR